MTTPWGGGGSPSVQFGFVQNPAFLRIATLFYAAITGVMRVVDQGCMPAATILATLGC